ncbi:NADPH-dependent FMN reductase [Nocardia higoensis]|uniref:NADPH-dependent FMN reductase n=1 Tax=Nocardia higoensis TaxID=228599 RepID=UPI000316C89A|nr:NADPH-dependent FMN reductase [Nocardia higoensis]
MTTLETPGPATTTILLISGSTRDGSTNTAALRTVAADATGRVHARLYGGLRELPAFVPGADPEQFPAVVALRAELARADAVLFSTPEYAGTLPGALKNLLDWTVGTADLYEKPVAWLCVAPEGRGDGAIATLASVLGYVGAAVVNTACLHSPVLAADIGDDGLVAAAAFRSVAAESVNALAAQAITSAAPSR